MILLAIGFWILVVHPNIFLMYEKANPKRYLNNKSAPIFIRRNVNEYFYIIQFTCHYMHMIRNFFTVSRFSRNSVYRINRMFSIEMSLKFIFQCYMQTNQFRLFCNLFAYTIFYYSLVLRITEQPVVSFEPQFQDFFASIWFSWITIFTIGFGEMVPVTLLGRVLVIFLLFQGMTLVPMITTSFTNKSKFDTL